MINNYEIKTRKDYKNQNLNSIVAFSSGFLITGDQSYHGIKSLFYINTGIHEVQLPHHGASGGQTGKPNYMDNSQGTIAVWSSDRSEYPGTAVVAHFTTNLYKAQN